MERRGRGKEYSKEAAKGNRFLVIIEAKMDISSIAFVLLLQ